MRIALCWQSSLTPKRNANQLHKKAVASDDVLSSIGEVGSALDAEITDFSHAYEDGRRTLTGNEECVVSNDLEEVYGKHLIDKIDKYVFLTDYVLNDVVRNADDSDGKLDGGTFRKQSVIGSEF